MKWTYDDGGRASAGYLGRTGDCVVRAVAIAAQLPYAEVYEALAKCNASVRQRHDKLQRSIRGKRSARRGVFVHGVGFKRYMASIGWKWTPTMGIGTGCTVHLRDGELPMGRIIAAVSRHYCAVIDGVIHDIYNPSERATTIYPPHTPAIQLPKGARLLENGNGWAYKPDRCVYGYWSKLI